MLISLQKRKCLLFAIAFSNLNRPVTLFSTFYECPSIEKQLYEDAYIRMRNIKKKIRRLKIFLLLCIAIAACKTATAQKDSLVLKNGDIIVGEIKSLTNGVLVIETPYSKNDFSIEWDGVRKVYSKSFFLITLSTGERLNGSFNSIAEKDSVLIKDAQPVTVPLQHIVYLKGYKSKFWSRFNANIDAGVTLQKANDLRQFNISSAVSYTADKWLADVSYTDNRSRQDSVTETRRTETNFGFRYYLQHDWFVATSLNLLSNTEQALNLRTTGKLGVGKYLLHTNKAYWGVGGGFSYNNETFTNETESRKSLEVYGSTELSLFDTKDIDLFTNIYIYRSLTEKKRWRSDFKLNLKYDLPWNFYVKPSINMNYDNRPAVKGNETDYVFTFAVGWEFD